MLRFCFLCLVFYSFMALRIAQPLLSVCDRTCLSTLVVKLYLLLLSPQAECCGDHMHCCPEGTICNLDQSSLTDFLTLKHGFILSHGSFTLLTEYFLKTSCPCCTEQVSAVMCDDGESECPEGTTCCETPDGSWGCCPMPKAVCCEDKIHCCPEGSTCDVKHSKCISLSTKKDMPMWAKLPARRRADWENGQGHFFFPVKKPQSASFCF
uniref:Granulins domain-containing protein n=1 Tax=Myripristis murdjan TaxID=586833 RepID=A0A667YKL8_9TELE